jgi:DNA-binding MarR family transcriptional regulator
MADINFVAERSSPAGTASDPAAVPDEPFYDLIELLFFSYRAFTGDADGMLARYGFGRAHHRALHFVARHPGITVAELLDILKITKQSLGRVLRELVETGFVIQREGHADRRQRLLYLTDKGAKLAADVASVQTGRLMRALADSGESRDAAYRLFAGILDPEQRREVEKLIARGESNRRERHK